MITFRGGSILISPLLLVYAVIIVVVLIAPEAYGQATPKISKITPESGPVGEPVTIEGTGFGARQDSSIVTFSGKLVSSAIWSDKKIIVSVPAGATSGDVVVTVAGASTATHFEVTSAKADQSAFEILTGVGAVLAGVENTSYKVDANNNALSATNVGRKRVEILLGGAFIMPWRKGGGWIEDAFCTSKDVWEAKAIEYARIRGANETVAKQDIKRAKEYARNKDCPPGGDSAYKNYRPWHTFLSIRFAPGSDQTINGFVVGGGYRITKYFSMLIGYSVTPTEEPSPGFRVAAAQVV